jgi:predicted Zn-dependent peptidase
MKRLSLSVLCGLCLTVAVAGAQQVPVREEFLANGMRLLMVERHDTPTVSCGWVARVGSVNEPPGITGISHLFEHMMFKGTKTIGTKDAVKDAEVRARQDAIRGEMEKEYSLLREKLRRGEIADTIYDPVNMTPRLKELKAQLEQLYAAEKELIVKDEMDAIYTREGGSGLNAFTSEDQTAYFITVPSNKLELWFWLESDRLGDPVFREFYSERDVVREERRLRTESTPTGKLDEAFDSMFWQSSPYSHPVVGWPSDVESITRVQAERYFSTYYAPNNLTAVLVGDFKPESALELARTYFGRIPAGATPPPEMITSEVPQEAERRLFAEADTNPQVALRFHAYPFYHKDMFALQLVSDLLTERTGRLYKALVEKQGLAVGEPYAWYRPMKYEGAFEVGAEVKEGRRPEEVEAALFAEIERLGTEPVGERELQKVKNQELADSFRRLQSNFFLLLQLIIYDSNGDWRFLNDAPARLQAVTAADVQRVARQTFTAERKSVATYVRKAGGTAEDPELAALPAQVKAMVKQQLAQIEQISDPAQLEQVLGQLQQMQGQVPPQMKPAIDLMLKRAEQKLDALRAAGSAAKTAGQGGA